MLAVMLVLLAADEAPPPRADVRAQDTAALGVVTAAVAAGLAVAIPIFEPHPGLTPTPYVLGTTAFVLVAFVRPVVFFSGQPRPPPTALNNVLRVAGTATALLGLISFISGFALAPKQPSAASWAMTGAAGLEALSALSFSIDAMLGQR